MTSGSGLRRFVRPAGSEPVGPVSPGPGPGPDSSTGPDISTGTRTGQAQDQGQSSAQSAAEALPPVMAQLLAASPAGSGSTAAAGQPAAGRSGAQAPAPEKCELCATEVPAEHGHIADLENASLLCACRACYLLFTQPTAGRGRYRAVPDRYLSDLGPPLTAVEWDRLEIPVGLAFFFRSTAADRVAGFYPSPAGVTECVLDLAAWDQLAAGHPLLGAPEPDVEAALICRTDDGIESFVVPIDACYELAGRMRLHWRGFDGGAEARASISEFLARVRAQARPFRTETQDG